MHSLQLQTNTYQGIIITNTTTTYYIFSYPCGDIQWSDQAVVGFNANADVYYNHPASGLPNLGRIVSCRDQTAVGSVAGVLPTIQGINFCTSIANADDSNIPDVNSVAIDIDGDGNIIYGSIVDQLPRCPATMDLAARLAGYIFEPFPEQGANCYRSLDRFTPSFTLNPSLRRVYQFASVCCYRQHRYPYQNSMQLLNYYCHSDLRGLAIRRGGEGRLTDLTPNPISGDPIDFEFKRYCCTEQVGCDRYLNKRPVIRAGSVLNCKLA